MAQVGSVYVFNTTSNQMFLILNNQPVNTLAGVQQSGGYAPTTLSILRNSSTGNPGNGTFGGTNTLVVSYPAGTSQSYTVNINANQQGAGITNDLQLYVYYNEVVLVISNDGANITQTITGTSVETPELARHYL